MMYRSFVAATLKASVGLTMFLFVAAASGQGITLGWDPDPANEVTDYVVYYGTSSGQYNNQIDVGTNTLASIPNLQPGTTYYFEVTAFGADGAPSSPSSEISYLMPGIVRLNLGTGTAGDVDVSFPVEPGNYYDVQTSPDAQNWTLVRRTDVSTSNDWSHYYEPISSYFGARFYRVVTHVGQ